MILRSNLSISCLDSVMFLYRLKYIYLRTFVTHFSAVSYGTYSIEAFCQFEILWRKAVKRLWHLPYTTHCNLLSAFAFGNNFCSIIYNRFVNFSHDCFSSNNVHIMFVALLAAESQMHIFGNKFTLYDTFEFACCVIVCLCCM